MFRVAKPGRAIWLDNWKVIRGSRSCKVRRGESPDHWLGNVRKSAESFYNSEFIELSGTIAATIIPCCDAGALMNTDQYAGQGGFFAVPVYLAMMVVMFPVNVPRAAGDPATSGTSTTSSTMVFGRESRPLPLELGRYFPTAQY